MSNDADLIRRGGALDAVHEADSLEMAQYGGQRIADRIAALPAVTPAVKVKPLVWRDDGTNGHETDHAFGFYEVYPSPEGDMLSRDGVDSGVYSSIEAAKAAAQADYEARIMSALDVTPAPTLAEALQVPEIKSLVDAARKMEENMGVKGVDVGSLRVSLFYALRRIAEGGK